MAPMNFFTILHNAIFGAGSTSVWYLPRIEIVCGEQTVPVTLDTSTSERSVLTSWTCVTVRS